MNFGRVTYAIVLLIVSSGCAANADPDTDATHADELSVSQARCTMQSASTCVVSPDPLCREAERVDQPSASAVGCAFLRDLGQCLCPRRAPSPRPVPCDPFSPWTPRASGSCHQAPPSSCALFDSRVPVDARPASVSGCVRQGNQPGVGACWCPD